MKVWVAYIDWGYEGKSDPLAVFTSQRLAEMYCNGSKEGYGPNIQMKEMETFDEQS